MSLLKIHAGHEGDAYVICVEGELELNELSGLERALVEAKTSRADQIVLDLDELTFIDSAGLEALVRAHRRDDERLTFTRGRGHVAEMLRLTALDLTLPRAASLGA